MDAWQALLDVFRRGRSLIAAALSCIFRIGIRWSAALLGIMFFCFVAMMDILRSIAAPHNRIAWTLAARETAFGAAGIILAIASSARARTPAVNRIATGALYLIALISISTAWSSFFNRMRAGGSA